MSAGLTTVQTARAVANLRWACGRLFEILGSWAGESDHAGVAVAFATAGRHLGWHAGDLTEAMPDSVLIEPDRFKGPPSTGIEPALADIAAMTGGVERLGIATRVLLPRLGSYCMLVDRHSAPHSDAPITRLVGFLLADLRRDRDEGDALLTRLLADTAAVEAVGAAVIAAESRLVAGGGLLPIVLDDE